MPGLTRTRVGVLLRQLFEVLLERPEGLAPASALNLLAERAKLTPYELESTASGRSRISKRLHYAATNLKLAGWIAKQDGKWLVTEAGKRAYARHVEPIEFFREGEAQRQSKTYGGSSQFAAQKARDEIREYLQGLEPFEFQSMVASLLRAMGYFIHWEAKPGVKDGNIDIIAWNDQLGLRPPRIAVQVKQTRSGFITSSRR